MQHNASQLECFKQLLLYVTGSSQCCQTLLLCVSESCCDFKARSESLMQRGCTKYLRSLKAPVRLPLHWSHPRMCLYCQSAFTYLTGSLHISDFCLFFSSLLSEPHCVWCCSREVSNAAVAELKQMSCNHFLNVEVTQSFIWAPLSRYAAQ